MSNSKPTLAYWDIKGRGEALRYMLLYADQPFEDKRYQFGPAPEFPLTQEWFVKDKPNIELDFPNLPYYIDADVKLSQTLVIARYLGRKHDLYPKNDKDLLRAELAEQMAQEMFMHLALLCYDFSDKFEENKQKRRDKIKDEIVLIEKFLGKGQFILGDQLTYADFLLFDSLDFNRHYAPEHFTSDTVNSYMNRMADLPRVKEYRQTSQHKDRVTCSPFARYQVEKI